MSPATIEWDSYLCLFIDSFILIFIFFLFSAACGNFRLFVKYRWRNLETFYVQLKQYQYDDTYGAVALAAIYRRDEKFKVILQELMLKWYQEMHFVVSNRFRKSFVGYWQTPFASFLYPRLCHIRLYISMQILLFGFNLLFFFYRHKCSWMNSII